MDPLSFLNPAGPTPAPVPDDQDPAEIIAAVAAARAARHAEAVPAAPQPEPVAAAPVAAPTPKPAPRLIEEIPVQFDAEGRKCGPRGVVLQLGIKLDRARQAGHADEVRQLEHWLSRARLRLRAWLDETGCQYPISPRELGINDPQERLRTRSTP